MTSINYPRRFFDRGEHDDSKEIKLPPLDKFQNLEDLPRFEKAGQKLRPNEINYIRDLTVEVLKIKPEYNIAQMVRFFGVTRNTYVRALGPLISCFSQSREKFSPIKKSENYQPTRDLKKIRFIKRIFAAREKKQLSCMVCGLSQHCGHNFLELAEIDHVNGRRDDNRPINLRVICPNCHSMCITTGSGTKPPYVNLKKVDIKKIHIYNTVDQLEKNTTKQRRMHAQTNYGPAPYKDTPLHELFRIYRPDESPRHIASLGDRLMAEGIKKPCCEACAVKEWRGLPISTFLQVHHKNSDRADNRIDNLAILCPNCHKLEHKKGVPTSTLPPSCPFDINLPEVQIVKNALGPTLDRHNMKELAKSLNMPYLRFERIGRLCFPELWFTETEKRGPRDFLTTKGKKAIVDTRDIFFEKGFHYEQTRTALRQEKDNPRYVPEPLFIFIYKTFNKAWRSGSDTIDPEEVSITKDFGA
jgi:5-methylcytosine-specific restriction endonuclease McrA